MEWVLLAYRLPREPSTPRIALWRRLRRLGALQLVDGLVALPVGAESREQLDWLADAVLEAGGEATVWVARSGTRAQDRALTDRLQTAVESDYRALASEAQRSSPSPRTVARLRRALRAIRARDHVGARDAREEATRAVEELAAAVEVRG